MRLKKKTSLGRQKIPMVKVENESHRQVTFSKRRSGLIKKASELSTLCGAEIAIIGFSQSKKPFAFGHQSVESVVDRCLFQNNMSLPHVNDAAIGELNVQLTQALRGLESEKKKKEDQAIEETRQKSIRLSKIKGWENPLGEMNRFQLQELKHELEKMRQAYMEHMAPVPASSSQSMQARYRTSGQHPPAQGSTGQKVIGSYRSNPEISPMRRNRMGNSSMGGGYPQQGGYQARQPSSWAPPGFGGYMQHAAYPDPPQYGQSVYGGYPQQTSNGYSTWDPNQQSGQGEYDYYGQQTSSGYYQPTYSSGYGALPPASTTPAYGQSQQLSGAPGSYCSQSGYALPSVSGYGQALHAYGFYGGSTKLNVRGDTPGSQNATPPEDPKL